MDAEMDMRRGWVAGVAERLRRAAIIGLGGAMLALAFSAPAAAQSRYADQWQDVMEFCARGWDFAFAIANCLQQKDREFGVQLTVLYQQALRKAGVQSGAIRQSQREWLRYQASTCRAAGRAAQDDGPSFAALASASCLVRTTLQRMDELEGLLSN